jgi:hypothetical protein
VFLFAVLIFSPIVRTPKKSEMALSTQVKESVQTATAALREGLAFAARAEHPMTIANLTDILVRLESLESMEEMMEKFSKPRETPRSF